MCRHFSLQYQLWGIHGIVRCLISCLNEQVVGENRTDWSREVAANSGVSVETFSTATDTYSTPVKPVFYSQQGYTQHHARKCLNLKKKNILCFLFVVSTIITLIWNCRPLHLIEISFETRARQQSRLSQRRAPHIPDAPRPPPPRPHPTQRFSHHAA